MYFYLDWNPITPMRIPIGPNQEILGWQKHLELLFRAHFAFEKEPAIGSKRKAINIYFAFIL